MAFPVSDVTTGDLITAAKWNADLAANMNTLRSGGIALSSQAAGDLLYASGSSQLARLGITNDRVLISSGGVPVWGATLPTVSGANLTNLNADNISTGNLAYARLPDSGGTWAVGGSLTLTGGNLSVGGSLFAAAGSLVAWTGRSEMSSPSDGVIRLTNDAGSDFGRLQFGGTTSSFPALKRSSAALHVRLADDSAYAALSAANFNGEGSGDNVFKGPIIGQRDTLPQLAIRRANASNQWNFWADDASGLQLSKVSVGTALTIDGSLDVDVPNTLTAGAIVSDSIVTAVGDISSVDDVVADSAGTPVSLKDHETRIDDLEGQVATLISQVTNLCNGQPC